MSAIIFSFTICSKLCLVFNKENVNLLPLFTFLVAVDCNAKGWPYSFQNVHLCSKLNGFHDG